MKFPAPVVLALSLVCLSVLPALAEEEDEGMWARLKRYDKDGDGKVTREEFGRSGRMFDRMDTDGDGAISKKEAAAMPARRGPGGRGGRGGFGGMMGGRGGLSLEKLDTDKDGSVSKREWAVFFEKADENGDEILQKEEWDAAVGGGRMRDDAPKVGAKAPKVSAKLLKAPTEVDLSAPKRTTVLVFGSWT